MVFAKADPRVQQLYEKSLVDPQYWEFGKMLRECVYDVQHQQPSKTYPQ